MKTKTITLYTYDELPTETAKEKAIQWWFSLGLEDWWEPTYEDAKNIGLEITGFDCGRGNDITGKLLSSPEDVIESILREHGDACDTYKLAKETQDKLDKLGEAPGDETPEDSKAYDVWQDRRENIFESFEKSLLEEYLSILRKEYEYQASDEIVAENIRANEYTFTENGKRED